MGMHGKMRCAVIIYHSGLDARQHECTCWIYSKVTQSPKSHPKDADA